MVHALDWTQIDFAQFRPEQHAPSSHLCCLHVYPFGAGKGRLGVTAAKTKVVALEVFDDAMRDFRQGDQVHSWCLPTGIVVTYVVFYGFLSKMLLVVDEGTRLAWSGGGLATSYDVALLEVMHLRALPGPLTIIGNKGLSSCVGCGGVTAATSAGSPPSITNALLTVPHRLYILFNLWKRPEKETPPGDDHLWMEYLGRAGPSGGPVRDLL
ncbi:hypothetical protein BD779DRAFT_1482355 [Infundibulicybe gibba]|nr:hypothetical protein BD779DRAFT_1482355 [Infundibulicybe gibba]